MTKRIFTGKVIKNKMERTVVVAVEVPKKHRFYSKDIKLTKTFKARDDFKCQVGEEVVIEESRPLGKTVNWIITRKLGETKK